MITVPGYQVLAKVYESTSSLVYRGIRELDNQAIILKVLKQDYFTVNELTRYKQEYQITSSSNLEGVVKAYSLEPYQRTLFIVFEDFGGISLAQLLTHQPLTLLEFLKIAIQITGVLSTIHRANIIHKDLNPSNIVINLATEQLKIIDFGISTVLTRENTTLKNPNILEGTLAYMSPEQTGRMNRSLDYRTDFYSLGITFYELLTNKLPFETTDTLELVHCHIAKQPTPPHQINPDIPQVVSDIVMKLLEKTAEERYQSAWGLKADLEECLMQLQIFGEVIDFPLASQDISDKFQIPQKLYGREQDIKTLLASFEQVAIGRIGKEGDNKDEENEDTERQGEENIQSIVSKSQLQNLDNTPKYKTEMILISGYSGIGKSALVAEIYKPVTEKRGYFISGKFDQYKRNIPYAAVVNAFHGLVRQLLTESEAQLQQWREKLLAALELNAQVIIDVISEVELIIGKQPVVPELAPTEAQNRFNLVFQKFIKVFTSPLHPLVIFLDDLQWADDASLKLIEMLMTSSDSQHLFLIGAYRNNEVNTVHPLMITLKHIQDSEVIVNQIILQPLELPTINEFISDTLKCSRDITLPLSKLVFKKTGGNPFFIIEFLKSLYTKGLLNFIPPQSFLINKSSRGGWQWNLDQIRFAKITDNVIELMALKIQKLPNNTQHALKLAACIGNQFELETLAIVNKKSPQATAKFLHSAIAEGLILPLSDAYKSLELDVPQSSNRLTVEYKFVHDRIQQAAYSLIPDESKQIVHRQVGQLLLLNTPLDNQEEKIFDIVNQLNLGLAFINLKSERYELAQLNLISSKKAKAATAYESAFKYLVVGLALLEPQHWQNQYELALALYIEAAEVAYLYGNFKEMERFVEIVLQQAKTILEKVKVYEVKIQAYIAQDKPKEAVNTALIVLNLLKIKLPKKPNKFKIALALWQTELALRGKEVEDLINLPQMTDPIKLAAMRILSSVISAASFTNPKLFPLLALKALNLSLNYGNTSLSAYAYATYGQILAGVVGNIDTGYRFGQLALALLAQFNSRELKAKVLLVVNDFIVHWREHVRETLSPFLEAYKGGLETGDLEFTARSAMVYSYHSYFIGKELTSLEKEIKNFSNIISQLKQTKFIYMNERYRQVVLNLMGKNENPIRLVGEAYDEDKLLPLHIQANDRNAIFNVYLHKAILCYLFQEYLEAADSISKAEKYLANATGLLLVPIFCFYDSLIKLSASTPACNLKPKLLAKKVLANQKKLKKWANHAPMNHLHKFYLVEAERHSFLGQDTQAMENYDRAISLAKENGYLNEEALAHELAAKFYLAKGKTKIAKVYMEDAYYCYLTWGATAKSLVLAQRYSQLLALNDIRIQGTNAAQIRPRSSSGEVSGNVLDLATVMKASQTIYGDIRLDKLLANLMKILIENAGAQKGFLILETKGKLLIEAEGVVDSDKVTVLQSIPVESSQAISSTIINYVARTRESVVLNNATYEGKFTNDSYVKEQQPKSILCSALINQGNLNGIFYLENNLTVGAFTSDRIQVLNMLSVQAAVSIKNSRFYNQLAELNKAYERFVPRQFLQFLEKESIVDVQLGDQVQQEMSILFADIRDFTTLSETLTPQDNFRFINAYLSRMESAIIENHGFIDKYIGDAIMALFSSEADNAVKAGIAMLHRLTDYNQHRINSGYVPIRIGIGINTGSLMLGTVGGQNRMDGTVISDAVNLASRLETLTKNYGVSLLISHHTLARLHNPMEYNLRFIEQVKVKGKSKAIAVFEVFDQDEPEIKESKLATKACFEEGVFHHHHQAFQKAAQCFEAVLSVNPKDTVAQVYQSRYLKSATTND